jgi:hypothetical protein
VGLFKSLFGRNEPAKPNLDNLFGIPTAAITLEAAGGFTAAGVAAVCYRQAEGGAFAAAQTDVQQLLDADNGPKVERTTDDFGFTWLVCRAEASQLSDLVTDVHAVNSSLENAGFGPMLLCSLVAFTGPDGKRFGLVYLYKQGTFYPFAPAGQHQRDNALELQIRGILAEDLPIERELGRWMALWGAPGL